jgi:hypothetical protein
MLAAFAIDWEDHLAGPLADALAVMAGGGILPEGSTGRLTIRGILVGVAEGCCRASVLSEPLDGAVLMAGEPWIGGNVDFCRTVPAESWLLRLLSTESLCLTVLIGGGRMIA